MLVSLAAEMSASGGPVVWRADLAPHPEIEAAALYLEDVVSGEWSIETVSLLPRALRHVREDGGEERR